MALPFSFASENLRDHDNSPCTTGPYDASLATCPLESSASPESMSVSPGGDLYYSPLSLLPLILSSNLSYDSPLTSTSSLDDLRSKSTGSIPRLIKPKVTRTSTTLQVLKLLQDARLNVLDLLKLTLAGEVEFASQRKVLFSPKNMVLLQEVLAGVFNDEKGAEIKQQFLLPRSIDIVSKEIHRELEAVKPHLRSYNDLKGSQC